MEVDEIERQVSKFQRVGSNGDNSSNPHKIATLRGNLDVRNLEHRFPDENGGGGGGGGGVVGRLCGWPSSRIVRVSRASGGKDRHSKVLTSKGLRDRRVRLSVTTAIQFYDLQDRLGYDQPSKAVEWLIKAASSSISELPSLDPSFPGADGYNQHHHHNNQHQKQLSDEKKSTGNDNEFEDPNYQDNQQQNNTNNTNNNNVSVSKSSACSSTSETSKGSGLSLSRSENRVRARERARDMAAKKEKEKDGDPVRAAVVTQVNGISHNSSFTDLLTGISNTAVNPNNSSNPTANLESRMQWTSPMDYFFNRPPQSSPQIIQMPQFNITTGDTHPHQQHFSFLQENFAPVVTTTGNDGGGESYNLNFSIASSSSGNGITPGFSRGTLQSNLLSILPHHHQLQRFQSPSMADGSTSTNFPFFIAPTITSGPSGAPDHFPSTGYESQRRQLYSETDDGGRAFENVLKKMKKGEVTVYPVNGSYGGGLVWQANDVLCHTTRCGAKFHRQNRCGGPIPSVNTAPPCDFCRRHQFIGNPLPIEKEPLERNSDNSKLELRSSLLFAPLEIRPRTQTTNVNDIARIIIRLLTNILAAVPKGSSNADEAHNPSEKSFCTACSLGLVATNVAPLSTVPSGNSKNGAYQSLIFKAGTRVLFEAEDADNGFTLNSSNCSLFMHSIPWLSASVKTSESNVLCSEMIGWRR
ncbi:hypothetical protein LXL04_027506 [Taraxacum kok-saghyz]